MIQTHLSTNKTLNNTLVIYFNDKPKPSLQNFKYDCLNLFNPKPNPWFFYHINDYLIEINKFQNQYSNILLLGGSKGGSASIVMANLLTKDSLFNNILCWAMSPILKIEYGKSLKCERGFISTVWDKIKDDHKIKEIVDKYGDIEQYIDCSFPLMYSYSYHTKYWKFDKTVFDSIKRKECIVEDFLYCTTDMLKFDKEASPYRNIHNILGYYWTSNKSLFYTKLELFIDRYT